MHQWVLRRRILLHRSLSWTVRVLRSALNERRLLFASRGSMPSCTGGGPRSSRGLSGVDLPRLVLDACRHLRRRRGLRHGQAHRLWCRRLQLENEQLLLPHRRRLRLWNRLRERRLRSASARTDLRHEQPVRLETVRRRGLLQQLLYERLPDLYGDGCARDMPRTAGRCESARPCRLPARRPLDLWVGRNLRRLRRLPQLPGEYLRERHLQRRHRRRRLRLRRNRSLSSGRGVDPLPPVHLRCDRRRGWKLLSHVHERR